MNTRVGASFSLSLLILALASVFLARPEQPCDPSNKTTEHASTGEQRSVGPPSLTPSVAWDDSGTSLKHVRTIKFDAGKGVRPSLPRRPSGPFTQVREGESMSDVAARIYGSDASVQTLWLANRDQLSSDQAVLRPGMVLRTPAPE